MADKTVQINPPHTVGLYGSIGEEAGAAGGGAPFYKTERVLRDQILLCLRKVVDPDLGLDIVACNFVKELSFDYDEGVVAFKLELTTPACPVKDAFVDQCTASITQSLEWVKDVAITVTSRASGGAAAVATHRNLDGVSFVVVVASCKGGVGKSSVAVNLAYLLKARGAKVGIADVDVFGPSLNTLIPIDNPQVMCEMVAPPAADHSHDDGKISSKETASTSAVTTPTAQKMSLSDNASLIPLEFDGIKLMSYSYFRPAKDAYAAVRGPIAGSLALQMITACNWEKLDYLIVDTPPGTGDIHLTLAQSLKITGAVVVTTPQRLSLIDVEKGIHFFRKLNIPTVGIIENMASIICTACGHEEEVLVSTFRLGSKKQTPPHHPCGVVKGACGDERGGEERRTEGITAVACHSEGGERVDCNTLSPSLDLIVKQFGVQVTARLPLDPRLAAVQFIREDDGAVLFPFAKVFDATNPTWRKLDTFVEALIRELSHVVYAKDRAPEITTTNDGFLQMATEDGSIHLCPQREVRLNCCCALCIDEFSATPKLNPRNIPLDVHIIKMEQSGNYSLTLQW